MSRYDSLRASDADRDAVTERLREAAGEGRLEPNELEERVGSALRARTYGELARLVADLPRPPNTPWQRPGGRTRAVARSALLGAGLLAAVIVALAVVAVVVVLVLAVAAWWLACVVFWLFCCGSRRRLAPGSPWRRAAPPRAHRPRPSGLL
jgi:Flp pilus assembly protein TadB